MLATNKLGLIVNPVAGMGGKVGLKGTDGHEILREAIRRGAKPIAPGRAIEALAAFKQKHPTAHVVTAPREMGEDEARAVGFNPEVVGQPLDAPTTPQDTKRAAIEMAQRRVDLLLFVGGDGTARDVHDAINGQLAVIGVPSGVKMYSAVFAISPKAAGYLAARYLEGELPLNECEVMDVDEVSFREDRLSLRLHGYLKIPADDALVQHAKSGGGPTFDEREEAIGIAKHVVEHMDANQFYILGPGTTTRAVAELLGLEKTLLGVDVLKGGSLVGKDVNERDLNSLVTSGRAKIVVTPIGGQGYIFGRGNQQISPQIIRKVGKEGIIVVATRRKLLTLEPRRLLVDTGDAELDRELCGFVKVITGYGEMTLMRVEA